MGWTKRQIVGEAYAELALAGYVFDLDPEELQAALRRLDTMMATWAAQGVSVGYALGATPDDSDLDQDSGLALTAVEAVYMALAVRIAAGKGKQLAASTLATAKAAYSALISRLASQEVTQQQARSGTPLGAGNKPWRRYIRPFVNQPDTGPARIDEAGGLDLSGA